MAELDGEITPEEQAELEAACAADAGLRRLRDQELRLVGMLESRGPSRAPEGFVANVMDRIRAEETYELKSARPPASKAQSESAFDTRRVQSQYRKTESTPWWAKLFGSPAVRWGFGLALPAILAFMILELTRQKDQVTDQRPPLSRPDRQIASAPEPDAAATTMVAPEEGIEPTEPFETAQADVPPPVESTLPSQPAPAAVTEEPTPQPTLSERTIARSSDPTPDVTPAPASEPAPPDAAVAAAAPPDSAFPEPIPEAPVPTPMEREIAIGEPVPTFGPPSPVVPDENFAERVWSPASEPSAPIERATAQATPPRIDPSEILGTPPTQRETSIAAAPTTTEPRQSALPPMERPSVPGQARQTTPAASGNPKIQVLLAAAETPGRRSPRTPREQTDDPGRRASFNNGGRTAGGSGQLTGRQIEIMMARRGTILRRTVDRDNPAVTHLLWRVTSTELSGFLRELERAGAAKTTSTQPAAEGQSRYFFERGSEPGGAATGPERTMEVEITVRETP